jgi:hypothetical protein
MLNKATPAEGASGVDSWSTCGHERRIRAPCLMTPKTFSKIQELPVMWGHRRRHRHGATKYLTSKGEYAAGASRFILQRIPLSNFVQSSAWH